MAHVYLTRSDVNLGFSQGQLVVREDGGGAERRLPFSNVDSINVFGNPQLSTQLIRECLSSAVPIGYYTEDGHYLGRAVSPEHVDPFRQKQQILLNEDNEFCLIWSKLVVESKLLNSIAVLRSSRDVFEFSDKELEGINHSIKCITKAASVDELMGYEGSAAKCYFACYGKLFSDCGFMFNGRTSRPPQDPVNALLSYGYSLLHRNIIGAIERHGLNPYFGFMHKLQQGHAALASDLIEDYRAFIIDRTVLSFLRSGEVVSGDFVYANNGAVYMSRKLMRAFTDALSGELAKKADFFGAYGDEFLYGFHVALDKKLMSALNAIDSGDPLKYQPFIWSQDAL